MIKLDPAWGGNIVIQRGLDNKCRVRVSGRFTGTPTNIEARVVDAGGSAVSGLDWFTLVANASINFRDGTFDGVFIMDAKTFAMRVQVRFSNATGTTAQSGFIYTGDVFPLWGQSNMEGFVGLKAGSTLAKSVPSLICVTDAAEASALGMSGTTLWQGTTGDGIITLGNAIGAYTGYPVGFIFVARGGIPMVKDSALVTANPAKYILSTEGSIDRFPLEAFLTKATNFIRQSCAQNGNGTDFFGSVMIHGEQDAIATALLAYSDGLTRLQNIQKALVPRARADRMPFFLTIVGKYDTNDVGVNRIASAMLQWAATAPNAVACGDRYDLPRSADGLEVHLTPGGHTTLARRLGMDILHWIDPATNTVPGRGPFVDTASRSAAVITATINLNGHTAVAKESGGSPTGFQVSSDDFATLRTINSVALSGVTLTITLASSPGATPCKLRYVSTNAAGDATDNLIYSTDVITGDALGAPLSLTRIPLGV